MIPTIGSKVRLNEGVNGLKLTTQGRSKDVGLCEGWEGEIIGYDDTWCPIIRFFKKIVKGKEEPCSIEGLVRVSLFTVTEEEKYTEGDQVELDRDVDEYKKGTKGEISCGCNNGEKYKVVFKGGDGTCVDIRYIKHDGKGRRTRAAIPEFEGGVTFDEAAPILTLEKYALLGKENIGLEPGSETPMTDGKRILLPKKIARVKHTRKKGEDCSSDPNLTMYVGLLYHEASHLRYGSYLADLSKAFEKFSNPGLAQFITNIVEDVRVEHQFKSEFIDQPKKIKPLAQTMRYITKIAPVETIEDPLQHLLALITQKACVGYTHGELVEDTKDEMAFLRTTYDTAGGKKSYARLFVDILGIIEGVKRTDATVLDSFDSAQRIYALLQEAFPPDQVGKAVPPDVPQKTYNFDEGPVRISDPGQTQDPKKRKEVEKQQDKQREKMDVRPQDIQREVDRMKREGTLPEDYQPPKSPLDKELDKADMDPLVEYVQQGLRRKGYEPRKADEIAGELK